MRDIRFRGKTVFSCEWEYGSLDRDEPQNRWYITDNETGYEITVDEETIGQFTGLYDKNKTPIYEGDIVRINGEEIMYCRHKAGYGAFEFSLSKELLGHTIEGLFKRLNTEALIFEVIGNIYDNPEWKK